MHSSSRLRSALYGGAFNPPHFGHLAAIRHLLSLPNIELIWVVPSVSHAFGKQMAPLGHRLSMLHLLYKELSFSEQKRVMIQDIETELLRLKTPPTPIYSLEVLRFLAAQYPDLSFGLALGPDNCLPEVFQTFYGADAILQEHGVLEIPSQEFERSTHCRQLLSSDAPLSDLTPQMPESVVHYALTHHLY